MACEEGHRCCRERELGDDDYTSDERFKTDLVSLAADFARVTADPANQAAPRTPPSR